MRDVWKNGGLRSCSCKSTLFALQGQCHRLGSQQEAGRTKTLMPVRTQVWLLVLGLLSDEQGFARAIYSFLHGQIFETKMDILFRAFNLCKLVQSTCQWWDMCSVLMTSFPSYPWNLPSQILTEVSHKLNQLWMVLCTYLKKSKGLLSWQAQAIFWLYTSRC